MIDWKWKIRRQQPIGLDIGHDCIKMIQLAADGGRISVLAAGKVRIDPAVNGDAEQRRDFVVSAIKRMRAEGDFRGRDVVSCLPGDKLKITSLRVAKTETEEIEQVLEREAGQRFGLDPQIDSISYVPAGDVKQGDEVKSELIVFAADNQAVKSHIEMLERAHLRPVAIDTVPCALFRSFGRLLRRQEDKDEAVVFVDVGSRFTTVVFGSEGRMSFAKRIPIGGESFNEEIAAKLGVGMEEAEVLRGMLRKEMWTKCDRELRGCGQESAEDDEEDGALQEAEGASRLDESTRQVMIDVIGTIAEELAREISLCFRYYTVTFRGKRAERVIFTGGGAYENILLDVLRRQLTVEIEVAEPLRGVDMTDIDFSRDKRGLHCEWAVAVGLGLKGWNEADEQGCDYERN